MENKKYFTNVGTDLMDCETWEKIGEWEKDFDRLISEGWTWKW